MTRDELKLKTALKGILDYTEKKPKTLADAEHMLAVISVIASETLIETEPEASSP